MTPRGFNTLDTFVGDKDLQQQNQLRSLREQVANDQTNKT
jgi:hypothetical protein